MNNNLLKESVEDIIKQNGNNDITGPVLQDVLKTIINHFGNGSVFGGVAIPTTTPINADVNSFYFANTNGIYPNFGGHEILHNNFTVFSNITGVWVADTMVEINAFIKNFEEVNLPFTGPLQLLYNNNLWELIEGKTANIGDTPINSSTKFNMIGFPKDGIDNYNFKISDSQTTATSVDLIMVSAKPAQFSGYLTTIEFISNASGKAKFAILKRNTFNNFPEVAGGQDSFGIFSEFEVDVIAGRHTYDVSSLNIFMLEGEYLAIVNTVGFVKPTIIDTLDYGWWQSGPSALLTYQPNDVGFTYQIKFEKYKLNEFPERTIVVSKNLANYNSIRNILDTITDANERNRYVVLIPNGVYPECDLQGKAFVKLIGESKDGVIITCDGNSSLISPSDYSYPAYANMQLIDIPREFLHTVFVKNDCHFENLTLDVQRAKYTVHIDNNGFKNATFKNVKFTEVDTNFTLGMGIWGGQNIEFIDCIVQRSITTGQRLGFVIHNSTAQTLPAKVIFENTKFVSCGYGLVSELGSNQDDLIELINCESDGIGAIHLMVEESAPGSGHTMWVNPSTGSNTTNPTEVPYNLKVKSINTCIDIVKDRAGVYIGYLSERPDYIKHYSIDYVCKCGVFPPVTSGTILSIPIEGLNNYCYNANPFTNSQTDGNILGVALNDSIGGLVYYSPIGKIAKTKAAGISLGVNQKLKFDNSGNLIPAPSELFLGIDAISFDSDATDGKPYIKILNN